MHFYQSALCKSTRYEALDAIERCAIKVYFKSLMGRINKRVDMEKYFLTYKRDAEKNPVYAISGVKDFDADHIFDCGQCFRWRRQPDGSWTGIAGSRIANIRYGYASITTSDSQVGTYVAQSSKNARQSSKNKGKSTLYITGLYGTAAPDDFDEFWRNYLDLDRDYGKIKRKLARGDAEMKKAIASGQGIRILNQDLWETIISFIISQNNNIPRIKGCIERLAALAGERIISTEDKAYLEPKANREMIATGRYQGVFPLDDLVPNNLPTPEKLAPMTVEDLAPVRLGYRAKYLIDTARQVLERGLPRNMEELGRLTGVGPKVANCIGLFGLGETASFPIDVWVKRVMHECYGFPEEDMKSMAQFAEEHYGDLGGFAQQYLFYYIRQKGV